MIDLSKTMLICIDIQNDFCPGGALAVSAGDELVPVANRLINAFELVALTQDWHPAGHFSFASTRSNAQPFSQITVSYGQQTLWPDHCVQGSVGAAFHAELDTDTAQLIIRKGFRHQIDSYSAFLENDHQTTTGLAAYLQARGVTAVVLCGLAFDYCVAYSALDAVAAGFQCTVVTDACRSIDLDGSAANATAQMIEKGVTLTTSDLIIEQLSKT